MHSVCVYAEAETSLQALADGVRMDAARPVAGLKVSLRRHAGARMQSRHLLSFLGRCGSDWRPAARVVYEAAIHAALRLHVALRRINQRNAFVPKNPTTDIQPHVKRPRFDSTLAVDVIAQAESFAKYAQRIVKRRLSLRSETSHVASILCDTQCLHSLAFRAFWSVWRAHFSLYASEIRAVEMAWASQWNSWADPEVVARGDSTACIPWSQ
jgi:hypothetical protein